jgi:membrane peptidoglycan carboxypeptidase
MTTAKRKTQRAYLRLGATLLLAVFLFALVFGLRVELESSPLQWRLFTHLADRFSVSVESGANLEARFPEAGPYDRRLGYTRIPDFVHALQTQGYRIEQQARLSPALESFIDLGGFPVYPEKSQAGLEILDHSNIEVYRARHPERVFSDFQAVPPIIVATLLFIENRELGDLSFPTRNPAVEWDRLAAAGINALVSSVIPTEQHFGGSTLATQIEKFRHSPGGHTSSAVDKLRQILSASVRAYQTGPDTTQARKRIVVDYLNSTPLSGRLGFGEVIGLGEGLHVWYGTDLDELTQRLGQLSRTDTAGPRAAQVYKQALSLLLAERRPSYYLLSGRDQLAELTDVHLRLLAEAGIVSTKLRDTVLGQPLLFRTDIPAAADASYVERKALNAVRSHLLSLLQVRSLYELDRLDMRVVAALDATAQRNVSDALRLFQNPKAARKVGLYGKRLLRRDPGGVAYSVTLYERGEESNRVRVQADNLDRPLDLNEGGMFDLGSTAKLRTLTTYLEIVTELHNRFASKPATELRHLADEARDPLTRWASQYLAGTQDRSLSEMLEEAMKRRYSGTPATFFTGGGRQSFANSDKSENRIMSVSEGFRHSVNLVFVRMMRDIVRYYQSKGDVPLSQILADRENPARDSYLKRFADREGKVYLARFYRRYKGLEPDEALALLASRVRHAPYRLAVTFRSVRPRASLEDFARFLHGQSSTAEISEQSASDLYEKYGSDDFDLNDRGYLAGVHPLELWLVSFLQRHPHATWRQVSAASINKRQEVYRWLFQARRKGAADSRIRIIAEEEAFKQVRASWSRQGYPFASLVPSLGTAIGSSADRPAALAELMGIILNDGIRLPTVYVESIHLAEGTPFETHLSREPEPGERVLPKQITDVLRRALEDVVANGTARLLSGVYEDPDGRPMKVGGKTGTGDELRERYGPGTSGAKRKEVSRSAAFAFFLGDRFFGVITAHVPGANVKGHRFTSALPTQILKALDPVLEPVLQGGLSTPIPGMSSLLAESATGDDAEQFDAEPTIDRTTTNRRLRRIPSATRSRSVKGRAPRIIDELF